MPPPATMGDAASWALFVLSFVSQCVLWVVMLRGGFRKGARTAADEAKEKADQAAALRELGHGLSTLAEGLKEQTKALNEHVVQDAKIHERLTTMQEQFTDTMAQVGRTLENHGRQITNVALGIAPAEATPIPATRVRRRAGA